ncbi:MAG: penicillin acylase family protein, partial [Candidatus Latescibacteria bacterium]|nr:penicillin acylase family protein [Candidatus Latescibacterota bacterium]
GSDAADVYEIALDSPITNRYRFDHTWRPIITDSLKVGVRINNTIEHHTRRYQQTHHGPILHRNNTHAYAYRFSLTNETSQIEQHYRMMTAIDLKTFYAALQLAQSGPQRIVYADIYGNIALLYTGRIPIRSEFHTWNRPINGNTSDTEWQGIHPQDDLLQIHNPPAGWLQDCDALPGQHTIPDPFTPDRYQTYIVNTPENELPRALRMRALLAASLRITQPEAIAFSQDTYIIHSEKWIRALNIALANQNRPDLIEALAILNRWNGRADRETSGMVMYALWRERCEQQNQSLNTAHILSSQPLGSITTQTLTNAFSETVAHLQTTYNRLNITYKEIHRFRQNDHSWPLAGSSSSGLTALRAVHAKPAQHIRDGISGPSCTTLVSFHPSKGVTSHSVVPFGQSDAPNSPHHTDQAERLFSRERLKPTHFGISPTQLKLQHTLHIP